LTIKQTENALALFESPDQHSRSLNDEGRKIIRVDGGYQIVNYGKYRDSEMRRLKRREYHREYWHTRKLKKLKGTQKHSNGLNETQQNLLADSTLQKQSTEADKEKSSTNGSRQSVEDWLKELEADETYKGLNVRQLYGRMLNWCKIRKKQPTKRRFVNWLNSQDAPLPLQHASRPDYKRKYMPPAREPTEAERENARTIAKQEAEKFKAQFR
jgi:hypothetical protein